MNNLIHHYGLQPADRIVTPKSSWNIVKHHAIYLGYDENGIDWVIENKDGYGVRCITAAQFFAESRTITRIIKFHGSNYERRLAVERALSLAGKPYSLINFNCEHFANYVQKGESHSSQIALAGLGLFVGCVLLFGSK